jgi:hypothetical protein
MAAPDPEFPNSKGTANASTGTSVTPSYPTAVQANDIIFLLAISYQPNGVAEIGEPSGFTVVNDGVTYLRQDFLNSSSVAVGRAALFWKRATGSETGTVTVTRTGDTGNDSCFFAQLYLVRGCATASDPWDDIDFDPGPGNATVDYPAITVSGNERTLAAFVAQADNLSTVDPPSDYAGVVTDVTGTGTDAELRLVYKENVSTDGATTSTGGETEGWIVFHLSLKPPPPTVTGAAALSGDGTISAPGKMTFAAKSALDGGSLLGSVASVTKSGAAVLTGDALLASLASPTLAAQSALLAEASLAAAGKVGFVGAASLLGEGVLSPAAKAIFAAQVSLLADGLVDAAGTVESTAIVTGAAALDGGGDLDALASVIFAAQGLLTADAALAADGTVTSTQIHLAEAALAGLADLVARGTLQQPLTHFRRLNLSPSTKFRSVPVE